MILMRETCIIRAIGKGALKIKTSLGPKMASSEASAIWAYKSHYLQYVLHPSVKMYS